MKSEIGECRLVLCKKAWGRTLVGNKLRSKAWWENRLQELINSPTVEIDSKDQLKPGIYNLDGTPCPIPIPFEKEIGWTDETAPYWLGWFQQAFKRYEH